MLRICRSLKLSNASFRSFAESKQFSALSNLRTVSNFGQNLVLQPFSKCRPFCTSTVLNSSSGSLPKEKVNSNDDGSKNPLKRFLIDKIRLSGPISVAEFMQICVGSPAAGYYSKTSGDIFGTRGDFITSPEFTQLIGELLGVWVVNEFMKLGHSGDWQLVELGPGSGALMQDMLGVLRKFRLLDKHLTIHLLETSRQLIKEQATVLCGDDDEFVAANPSEGQNFLCSKVSEFGPTVFWYDNVKYIPKKFSVVVAHEFFDAMPVYKFRKTEKGWREILLGLDDKQENLAFSLAPNVTNAQKLYLTKELEESTKMNDLEISPASAQILTSLIDVINENGGTTLLVDYGEYGAEKKTGDTLRAFRNHKIVDPLLNPGRCDLTCDVNFDYLLSHVTEKSAVFGPLPQKDFLKNLGLKVRFDILMKAAKSEEEKAYLQKSYDLLTNSTEMGDRFKAVAFFPKVIKEVLKEAPPSGFCPLS